jgi:hypothetical protein
LQNLGIISQNTGKKAKSKIYIDFTDSYCWEKHWGGEQLSQKAICALFQSPEAKKEKISYLYLPDMILPSFTSVNFKDILIATKFQDQAED